MAEMTPIATPTTRESTKAEPMSRIVLGTRSSSISATERPVKSELPRFPCMNWKSHLP
ncbi:hypothetical protein D3C87_2190620 [compost metagenome]